MSKSPVDSYLEKYSDHLAEGLHADLETYESVIVIPLRNEETFFFQATLPSLESATRKFGAKVLAILVLNAREDDSSFFLNQQSRLCEALGGDSSKAQSLSRRSQNLDLLIVNCFIPGRLLEAKEGVGRARKVGSDLALRLFCLGKIKRPWIYASDGDVFFEENYFQNNELSAEEYALVNLPFAHFVDSNVSLLQQKAITYYDSYLRYYVSGLEWAGFEYAFHNVGSTQVLSMYAYCKVRGYPNLMAGEDFYIAQKLAKVGKVFSQPGDAKLYLSGRESDRVPFGTGTSVSKIMSLLKEEKIYEVYHPNVFVYLSKLIVALSRSAEHQSLSQLRQDLLLDNKEALWGFLEKNKISSQLERLWKMSPQLEMRRKHITNYFDSFVILKLVHYLRDEFLGTLELDQAWRELEALGSRSKRADSPRLYFQKEIEAKYA